MKIVTHKILASLASVTLVGFSAFITKTKPEFNLSRPNIIIILADDMGYGDTQCNNPNAQTLTPHLNQLAKEGLRFTDAHSGSAVCTPTRYGLLTGRYAFRSPLKKGVLGGYSPMLIEPERFTVADLLKQAGYKTAAIGKWHLGLNWPSNANLKPQELGSPSEQASATNVDLKSDLVKGPNDLGFDYSYIISSSLDIPPYVYLENGKPTERVITDIAGNNNPRGVFWRAGKGAEHFKLEQTLDHFTQQAQTFIQQASRDTKPFFLYLPLTSPHTPWLPAADFQGKSKAGIYGDFVTHTDDVVGRILKTLDEAGVKDNTLVIFTSDNGADWKPGDAEKFPAHQANYIYRGQKSDIWEGGHRVPFLVRWPAAFKNPRSVSQTVCLTDMMATFATLTKQSLPAHSAQDSFDFSTYFTSKNPTKANRVSTIHHSISGMFAIRKGKWKYVEGQGSGGWSKDESPLKHLEAQLYDLENDPRETSNLLEKQPVIASEMKSLLIKQREQGFSRMGAKE
ncbi:sulfatase-like hydrolase/transferase [Runella sp. MFBS21]|uniref:sulfatase-like hydrolase/transferase n=1 Tax=Runella sp. MFBS21 TaxID=3034018 RepID=UPI0023F8B34D|nr:sulfatase-like hydrolase/transferase [Runella sp. MFBS21]MDF7815977.1 sulfatase-like hydrolase/transferase [Runella sp. MFBS21]